VQYGPTDAERDSLQFRRSLYVVKDLQPGDELGAENVRAIRPGLGLAPKHLEEVMGRKVNRAVARGTPLSWSLLK
jgi:sialic acid synthase SpsE